MDRTSHQTPLVPLSLIPRSRPLRPLAGARAAALLLASAAAFALAGCAELQTLRTENAQQEHELTAARAERDQFKKAYYDVVAVREKESREAGSVQEQLEREKEDAKAELTLYKEQVERDKAAADAQRAKEKAEAEKAQKDLRDVIEALKTDLAKTREELAAAQNQQKELQSRAETAEKSVGQVATERDLAQKQLATLREQTADAQKKAQDLEKRLADATAALDEQKKLREDRDKLIEKQQAEIERLNREMVRLKTESVRAPAQTNADAASTSGSPGGRSTAATLAPESARAITAEVRAALEAAKVPKTEFQVAETGGAVVARISSDWLFNEQSVVPADAGTKALAGLAGVLVRHPDVRARVEGHTDSTPVRNLPFPDNWGLASARADAVVRWLETEGKVSGEFLTPVGRSRFDPLAPNTTPEGRKQNRRVEIWILPR